MGARARARAVWQHMDEYDDRRLQRRRGGGEISVARLLPKPGPKLYTGMLWWVFGLYVLFYARAPYKPSAAEEQTYGELMQQAIFSEEAKEAQNDLLTAERRLAEVHVFGWRWRSPYSQQVPPRMRSVDEARGRLEFQLQQRNALISEAKAQVGIWSEYGVEEVRDRFWKAYQSGKDFAKRMTWWDLILGVGGRRDEEAWVTMFRYLAQIMMNFTIGLISALFSFCFSLVSMLWEYKTSYLSGLLFFLVAMSGASAMVATFIGGMYTVAVGGVYVVLQSNANNPRLQGRRQNQVLGARYEHYD